MPVKEAEKEDEAENEPTRKAGKKETTEVPSSQPVEYYLKHKINKRLIEGLVGNHRSGKHKISFHRIPESLCKIERGVKNEIDPIAPTMTVNRLVLEWEERINLHLEREMKFDQWKSEIFKSKHPALVKVEGEMGDEGEVT
nr:hypothetical protein [Tanacetum cinerariifolium]